MILTRYLTKEVLNALLTVTFVLLLIFLSNQLVRYLSYVASGKLGANLLLQLLGFEIPVLLAILLPLGLYLGIILAYGRLYTDNEMIVMQSGGLSTLKLTRITCLLAVIVTCVVFALTNWINPLLSDKKTNALNQGMTIENLLERLMPGRFQVSSDGRRVVYVESIKRSRKQAENIFIADQAKVNPEEKNNTTPSSWIVLSAAKGYQLRDQVLHETFLVAENGSRYEGIPGQNDYRIIQFKRYAIQAAGLLESPKKRDVESLPSLTLLKNYNRPDYASELQWRLSIPLSAFLLALLAIPLSYTKPRQGKYAQLLPAILIYVIYINLLFMARSWIEQKTIPIYVGMWWVHILILMLLGAFIFFRSTTFKKIMG